MLKRLQDTLVPQAGAIWAKAEEAKTPMRVAAFVIALERLLSALKLKE